MGQTISRILSGPPTAKAVRRVGMAIYLAPMLPSGSSELRSFSRSIYPVG